MTCRRLTHWKQLTAARGREDEATGPEAAGQDTVNANRFPMIEQLSPSNLEQRAQDR